MSLHLFKFSYFFFKSGFYSFQHRDLIHILLHLYLILSFWESYYKWIFLKFSFQLFIASIQKYDYFLWADLEPLAKLIYCRNFFVDSLGFSTYTIMPSAETVLFLPFQSVCHYFFKYFCHTTTILFTFWVSDDTNVRSYDSLKVSEAAYLFIFNFFLYSSNWIFIYLFLSSLTYSSVISSLLPSPSSEFSFY